MSSSLEQDFDGFDFSNKSTKIIKNPSGSDLSIQPILEDDEQIEISKPLDCIPADEFPQCEVCTEKFLTKKELRAHITVHLGQPRVILKRCNNINNVKKKDKDKYCTNQEKKGSLKLTLKKQNHSDFAVINKDFFDYKIEDQHSDDDNDDDDDEDGEDNNHLIDNNNGNSSVSEGDEIGDDFNEDKKDNNFIIIKSIKNDINILENFKVKFNNNTNSLTKINNNQQYYDNNILFDNDKSNDTIDEQNFNVNQISDEDMADPLENKQDLIKNSPDYHNENHNDQSDDEKSIEDNERTEENINEDDPEKELEETCRETIENLKKLGEQSSSRSMRIDMSPRNDEISENSIDIAAKLEDNPSITLIPRNRNVIKNIDENTKVLNEDKIESDDEKEEREEEIEKEKDNDENNDHHYSDDDDNNVREREEDEEDDTEKVDGKELETEKEKELETESLNERTLEVSGNDKEVGDEEDKEEAEGGGEGEGEKNEDGDELLENFLNQHNEQSNDKSPSSPNLSPFVETEYVSLEKLAEKVNTCRVCNQQFVDKNNLEEHKSITGHYQCDISDCSNLIFKSIMELSHHKSQHNDTSLRVISPNINLSSSSSSSSSSASAAVASHLLHQHSPRSNESSSSPSLSSSPRLLNNSPHNYSQKSHSIDQQLALQINHHHQVQQQNASRMSNSQQMVSPINFDQLQAPVQQLAQQVQRMPMPQHVPPPFPPGANTMIPGSNYYVPQRMYRPGHQPMHQPLQYPPHLAHLYQHYPPPPYPSYPGPHHHPPQSGPPGPPPPPPPPPPSLQTLSSSSSSSSMSPNLPRNRHPTMISNVRAPRISQILPPAPKQRLKRSLQRAEQLQQSQQQQQQQQQQPPPSKQRRLDMLIPDRNEDADCHVIAQQKRNEGVPMIQNVQGSNQQNPRNVDSTIHLTDSITLSVRQPGSSSSPSQNSTGVSAKKTDAKAVANVLAARGITVTPTANKNKQNDQQKQSNSTQQQQQQQQQQQRSSPTMPANVTALNLNSAISIIPANSQRKQQQQQQQQQQPQQQEQTFAVPQSKQQSKQSDVERPPRPPTVDLTQDSSPVSANHPSRRGRPTRASLVCIICDKNFQSHDQLIQHMGTHRTSKLNHKCNLCSAQYPTAQDLALHKQTYHKENDTNLISGGVELAIPIVDLKSPKTLSKLSNLGIQSYIPLSQLSAQTGGYFALPIISIDGSRNSNSCNLGALGAASILSLGPLKHLSSNR